VAAPAQQQKQKQTDETWSRLLERPDFGGTARRAVAGPVPATMKLSIVFDKLMA
jgi:hypothetical protein